MHMDHENEAYAASLCEEVLGECRTELMMAFRFMDAALWRAPFLENEKLYRLDTDGASIQFGAKQLLERYLASPSELVRDYLHVLLHCVFRHPFDVDHDDAMAWDIACDIVVEGIALEMAETRWRSDLDEARAAALDDIRAAAGSLSPVRVYRLVHGALLRPAEASLAGPGQDAAFAWRTLFFRDTHSLWKHAKDRRGDDLEEDAERERGEGEDAAESKEGPSSPQDAERLDGPSGEERAPEDGGDSDDEPDGDSDAGSDFDERADDDFADGARRRDAGGPGDAAEDPDRSFEDDPESPDEAAARACEDAAGEDDEASARAERDWLDIAKRMEVELASFSQSAGEGAGSLVMNLQLSTRPPVDYAEFLRQFATVAEELKVNDDEFDYIFYTYGLSLYGSMPLVEPLEYQETKRVREFAIAIDTSGSCSGELVRMFVTRTCEILRENEGFGKKVNIHVIQCDARVQRVDKITSLDDLREFGETFRAYGGGGTNFRPVFEYLDERVARGEFENLQGLIYFTDGEGVYPDKMPAYDTAFVFVDDDSRSRRVPPWAMKVVIDQEGIRDI